MNLYGFCGNDGINGYDYLGMDMYLDFTADGPRESYTPNGQDIINGMLARASRALGGDPHFSDWSEASKDETQKWQDMFPSMQGQLLRDSRSIYNYERERANSGVPSNPTYYTSAGDRVPLTPGRLTLGQIKKIQMDALDGATILRLLGRSTPWGLEDINIDAARLALYANQGSAQLAQVRAIGFMAYAVNYLMALFQPRANAPMEAPSFTASFAPEGRGITVIGSMRDIARGGYNVMDGFNTLRIANYEFLDAVNPGLVDAINENFMRIAIKRGDDFWLVTDPILHGTRSMSQGFQSRFLNIEIPMLNAERNVRIPIGPFESW